MVESFKELKRICKKEGVEEKGLAAVYRYISFYFTKILLYFPLNANQVSIIGVEIGIIASVFFLFGKPLYFVIGGILLFFHMLLDYCDGEIARYYKIKGGLGGFFDWSNCLPRPLVIFFLTFSFLKGFTTLNQSALFLFGFIASFFWFLNHIFIGLRINLFRIIIADNNFENEIRNKISRTLNMKLTNVLIRFFDIVKRIIQKYRIVYLNEENVNKKDFLIRIRAIVRKTQDARVFPFVFVFSGLFDFVLFEGNYITFIIWIYFGISGIILFVAEEFMIKTYKKEI